MSTPLISKNEAFAKFSAPNETRVVAEIKSERAAQAQQKTAAGVFRSVNETYRLGVAVLEDARAKLVSFPCAGLGSIVPMAFYAPRSADVGSILACISAGRAAMQRHDLAGAGNVGASAAL